MFHPRRCGLFRTSVGSQLIGNTRQRTSHLQLCSPCFFKTPFNTSQQLSAPRCSKAGFQGVPSDVPKRSKFQPVLCQVSSPIGAEAKVHRGGASGAGSTGGCRWCQSLRATLEIQAFMASGTQDTVALQATWTCHCRSLGLHGLRSLKC